MNEDDDKPPSRSGEARALLKIGGEVVADRSALVGLLAGVRRLTEHGWRFAVVHGAGPQANELQAQLGIAPKKIGGRRVTDAATLRVVKQALAGEVNVDVVAAALGQGLRAVGIAAGSGGLVVAHARPPGRVPGEGDTLVDYGFVGEVAAVDPRLIEHLWAGGYTPVINPVSIAGSGSAEIPQVYNVNADTVASAVAHALAVDHLFLVTSVPGVLRDKDDPTTRIPVLTVSEARRAIADGVIVGGMIPKVEDVLHLLDRGIGAVHIMGPSGEALAGEATQPGRFGTVLRPDGARHV